MFAGITCVFAAESILKLLGGHSDYLYARASGTVNISTLTVPEPFPDASLAPQPSDGGSEEEESQTLG